MKLFWFLTFISIFANTLSTELIVLSAPSVTNSDYRSKFNEIIKFQINFANLILGRNKVIVLADKVTIPYLTGKFPKIINVKLDPKNVLEANVDDIWIRDFGTIHQTNPVKVGYLPQYWDGVDVKRTQNTFLNFLKKSGITTMKKKLTDRRTNISSESLHLEFYPDINIDGGNVVYDYEGNAIMTDRFMDENKLTDRKLAKSIASNVLGFSNVVIVTQTGNMDKDTTGHSDGMVSFIDANTVAYSQLDNEKQKLLESELNDGLKNFNFVELPNFYIDEKDPKMNFSSACGLHVNALTTKDYIYMPTFGQDPKSLDKGFMPEMDARVYQIMQQNTRKQVVNVTVPYDVCILGGSVRCLSMQIEGPIANKLIELAAFGK